MQIDIRSFESPFDLLSELIEKSRIDIYDISIAEITDQYLDALAELERLDMDLASEFLVMAATLLQIKSLSLLPAKKTLELKVEDPRDELILKLMRYRRFKFMAEQLQLAHLSHGDTVLRLPETAARLGISADYVEDDLDLAKFLAAVKTLDSRNRSKYHDLRKSVKYLLRRDKVSIRDKVKEILREVWRKKKIYFSDIFPAKEKSRLEQVTAFLALLELMRQNRIKVSQSIPYGSMLIEKGSLLSERDLTSDLEIEDEEELYD